MSPRGGSGNLIRSKASESTSQEFRGALFIRSSFREPVATNVHNDFELLDDSTTARLPHWRLRSNHPRRAGRTLAPLAVELRKGLGRLFTAVGNLEHICNQCFVRPGSMGTKLENRHHLRDAALGRSHPARFGSWAGAPPRSVPESAIQLHPYRNSIQICGRKLEICSLLCLSILLFAVDCMLRRWAVISACQAHTRYILG